MDDGPVKSAAQEFGGELEKLIDYFSMEFDLSIGQMIGVLEVAKFNIMMQASETVNEDEDEEDEDSIYE